MNKSIFVVKLVSASLCLLATIGCSSPTIKTQFYTLSQQTTPTQLVDNQKQLGLIVIENIALADYLRQQGIAVKQSASRLQISSNHRWAESLEGALARSLRSELESNLENHRIELVNRHWQTKAKYTIKIEVTQFEVDNTTRNTVHSGRYWIHNQSGVVIGQRRFNISLALAKSGFEGAVKNLQQSVVQLGELLSEDINQLSQ